MEGDSGERNQQQVIESLSEIASGHADSIMTLVLFNSRQMNGEGRLGR